MQWDGRSWTPEPGVNAPGDLKEKLDQDRQQLLDSDANQQKSVEDALNGALPMSWGGNSLVSCLRTQFTTAKKTTSPLILDLDGLNGAETISQAGGVHFDHDGNKFSELTGWVGKNDGLLVWDKNGNGQIDNGAELFGNNTVLKNGRKAANGFAALIELDINHDKKIDANDASFAKLRVFKDANSNGVVDAGELLTLTDAGVKSLNTGYTDQNMSDANGNQHLQVGSFTTAAGQSRAMDDVWFAIDTARSTDSDLVAVSEAIAVLPDFVGFGNVHSLHQAIAHDGSGKLQRLLQSFINCDGTVPSLDLMDQLLWAWTGADQHSADSRGRYIDARRLYTVEAFAGEGFFQEGGSTNPYPNSAAILNQAYTQFRQAVYEQLLTQGLYKPLYDSIALRWDADTGTLALDVSTLTVMLKTWYDANPKRGQAMIAAFADNLEALGEVGAQTRAGLRKRGDIRGQGFDLYLATMGSKPVLGSTGADILTGDAHVENFFAAGRGADVLYGGSGSDSYQWSKGDGSDVIGETADAEGVKDTLVLLDVSVPETWLSRDASNLYVTVGAERIKIANHFGGASLEQIEFGDGSTWERAALDAAAFLHSGTSGNDTLSGTFQSDVFVGGTGADRLNGGAGADTYIWKKGDGNDIISEAGDANSEVEDTLKLLDVKASETQLGRDSKNLYITVGSERIKIADHFNYSAGFSFAALEQIQFGDGMSWDREALDAAPYLGTAGNDKLTGTYQAETFIGGKGADTLNGGSGADTYLWKKGEGNDLISEVGDATSVVKDTLKLLDVSTSEAQLSRDQNSLYVSIGGEKIKVVDHFTSYLSFAFSALEKIQFNDGTTWEKTTLDLAPYLGTAGNDKLTGTYQAETFNGGKGADTLNGGAGADTYVWKKGDGNDIISEAGDAASSVKDTLKLLDVNASEAQLSRDQNSLYVTIGPEKIKITNHFTSYYGFEFSALEQIRFSDGATWEKAALDAAAYRGTAGKDTIYGTAQAETFVGGAGDDVLSGGAGGDTYQLSRGDGCDVIAEGDVTAGNTDVLQFMAGTSASQLWFRRTGNSLEVSVIGTADKATVRDWYLGNVYHVEQIKSGDGKLLLDTDVQKLVQAMAAFAPPAMGQTSLSATQQTVLAPVLAANWH